MRRPDKAKIVQRASLIALAVLAVGLGTNLLTAAQRSLDAYAAYDDLELTLESFGYIAPDQPVVVNIGVRNPSDQTLNVKAMELSLAAGAHTVGGGTIRPGLDLPANGSTELVIDADINDVSYVERWGEEPIDWLLTGRVLVQLEHGEATWIPFGARSVT